MRDFRTQAERAVIGSLIVDPTCWPVVAEYIEGPDCFEDPDLGRIYEAMREIRACGNTPDVTMLCAALHDASSAVLTKLAETVDGPPVQTSIHAEQYAQEVAYAHAYRQLAAEAVTVARMAGQRLESIEEVMQRAARMVEQIRQRVARERIANLGGAECGTMERLRAMAESDGVHGLATGFPALDRIIGGLNAPDILCVAGRPGGGKTAWCLNVAINVARKGVPVLFVSLEMGVDQLNMRAVQCIGKVDTSRLKTRFLRDTTMANAEAANAELATLPIKAIAPGSLTVEQLAAYIQRQQTTIGCGLVIVDYLQLMAGGKKASNRQEEVAEISRGIKRVATEQNVPVIVAAQLNRDAETNRPRLSHLRESGAIEQDADRVLFLVPDADADRAAHTVNVIADVAKNRHSNTGETTLTFERHIQLFRDPSVEVVQSQPTRFPYADPPPDDQPFDDYDTEEIQF
jgi:replicative DNA helicase